ncbi:MAG: hypothetical protein Q7Q71_05140 [Verrucomicrobiota bacterium JB023]|nr:hypothetical protein [Verrucomicrobiota bacterium JB023]
MKQPNNWIPTEEQAVFEVGRRLSERYHEGEELPEENFLVGKSWVTARELMEEYEKHFPPEGQRKTKRLTHRKITYSLNRPDWDYRGEALGLQMSCDGVNYTTLEKAELFRANGQNWRNNIFTSTDNRYDVLYGNQYTLVIDKVNFGLSVARLKFRVSTLVYSTFHEETPFWGNNCTLFDINKGDELIQEQTCFPFIPFDHFWSELDRYIEMRRKQIGELHNDESAQKLTLHHDH